MNATGAARTTAEPESDVVADGIAIVPPAEGLGRGWAGRLAHNLSWNVVSEAAARGASLWLSFWCARALPVSDFGRFGFALAVTQYAWLAGDAVANGGYATRELARHAHDARAGAIGWLFLRARLAAALVLTLLAAVALVALPAPLETRRVIAGASLFFVAYAAFPDWALRAREDFRGLALANLSAAGALVAETALLLPRHPDPALAAALWGLSFAVAALVALPRLVARRAFSGHGGAGTWRSHFRNSFVYSLGAVGGIGCAQAPLILIGSLGTPYSTGLFGAAYRLVLVVLGVFSVLWWPLFPVLARSRPGEREFREAVIAVSGTVLLLSLPATLAYALWPRELLTLAFGARYAGAAGALRLAGCVLPFYAASGLLEQVCLATGGEAVRAKVYGGALVLMIAVAVPLVPAWGTIGAAAAALVGFGTACFAYAIVLRGVLPWRAMLARTLPVVALAAALALLWIAARASAFPAIPSLVIGAFAYVAAAIALRLAPGRAWLASWRTR